MNDYGCRVVVDLGFEAALGEASRAIREEGLQIVARIDVRNHFWRDIMPHFRQYFLLQVWSPELALETLRRDLDVGTLLPTTFAVYELADDKTAVVAKESPLAADPQWRRDNPAIAALADAESERVARALERLRHTSAHRGSVSPAA